jgi:hypothetical protein
MADMVFGPLAHILSASYGDSPVAVFDCFYTVHLQIALDEYPNDTPDRRQMGNGEKDRGRGLGRPRLDLAR